MKRDMERRIFDLQTSVEEVDRGTERKLKKELRKYRMLYKDAKKASETQVSVAFLRILKTKIQNTLLSLIVYISVTSQDIAAIREL